MRLERDFQPMVAHQRRAAAPSSARIEASGWRSRAGSPGGRARGCGGAGGQPCVVGGRNGSRDRLSANAMPCWTSAICRACARSANSARQPPSPTLGQQRGGVEGWSDAVVRRARTNALGRSGSRGRCCQPPPRRRRILASPRATASSPTCTRHAGTCARGAHGAAIAAGARPPRPPRRQYSAAPAHGPTPATRFRGGAERGLASWPPRRTACGSAPSARATCARACASIPRRARARRRTPPTRRALAARTRRRPAERAVLEGPRGRFFSHQISSTPRFRLLPPVLYRWYTKPGIQRSMTRRRSRLRQALRPPRRGGRLLLARLGVPRGEVGAVVASVLGQVAVQDAEDVEVDTADALASEHVITRSSSAAAARARGGSRRSTRTCRGASRRRGGAPRRAAASGHRPSGGGRRRRSPCPRRAPPPTGARRSRRPRQTPLATQSGSRDSWRTPGSSR